MIIYHNGRCTKSRSALELLQEQEIPHSIRLYLAEPLTKLEIKELLQKLDIKAPDLIRKNEPYYKEYLKGKKLTAAAYVKAMSEHPELIERPIVENGIRAVIARPAERLLELL